MGLLYLFFLLALDWQNTGELTGALTVTDLVIGPNGYLYAAVNIDTTSADSGWVFRSTDFYNWEKTGDIPGDVRRIFSLIKSRGDTLFAGTRLSGYIYGCLFISSNGGTTWSFRSQLGATRVGDAITALLEDNLGNIHAGHNYMGMTGYSPCRSTDRGFTWSNGTTSYNAYHYCLLQPSFNNNLYCGTWATGAVVLKSTDGGLTWSSSGGTMYDAGHSTTLIEAPGGVLYAGTYPKTGPAEPIGRVFKSTDGGANWIQVGYGYFNNTSGIRSLCRTSDGNLYAGTAPRNVPYAEVYVSTDGGNTWSSTGSLPGATVVYKLLEVNTGDAVYLYAATGPNGDVFRAPITPVTIYVTGEEVGLRILPNPTKGLTTVYYNLPKKEMATLRIYNTLGELVYSATGDKGLWTIKKLPAGIYLLRFEAKGYKVEKKLIVVK